MTRGALYHHFADKRDLFRAVHEQLEAELVEQSRAARDGRRRRSRRGAPHRRAQLLDACEDPSFARITLIDAPAVLGWEEWRRIDEEHALS